jgi:hypothetical protein
MENNFLNEIEMQKFKNVVPLLIQNLKDRKILLVHTFEEIMSFQRYKLCNPKEARIAGQVNFKGGGVQVSLDTPTLNHKPLCLDPQKLYRTQTYC